MYHIHANKFDIIYMPKFVCLYQYHEFSFLFGLLFIHIFMRPGSGNNQAKMITFNYN